MHALQSINEREGSKTWSVILNKQLNSISWDKDKNSRWPSSKYIRTSEVMLCMLCRYAQTAHLSRLIKYKFAMRVRLPKQNKKSKENLKIFPIINRLWDNLWTIYTITILFAYKRYLSKATDAFSKLHSFSNQINHLKMDILQTHMKCNRRK